MIDAHDPAWNGDGTAELMKGVFPKGSTAGLSDGCMVSNVTWRTKLYSWLFPSQPRPVDECDKRTYLTIELAATLSWSDRLRVLVLGKVRTTAIVYTDVEVKEARTAAVTWIG